MGSSGALLRKVIRGIGFSEKEIFITSVVKYLSKKGTPTFAQIAHGEKHFEKQLTIIEPKVVVLLGRVATVGVLDETISIAKKHGTWRKKEGHPILLVTILPLLFVSLRLGKHFFKI